MGDLIVEEALKQVNEELRNLVQQIEKVKEEKKNCTSQLEAENLCTTNSRHRHAKDALEEAMELSGGIETVPRDYCESSSSSHGPG